jgi:phosphoadenosine phosphosulfate reductase
MQSREHISRIEMLTDLAIERLRTFQHNAGPLGYYVAFSGGKDSCVLKHLCERSGVKCEYHFNVTTIDPPELYRFVKDHHNNIIRHYPQKRLGEIIIKKGMPPTRVVRYCCEILKEGGGEGRIVVTGIRWEESTKRSKRRMMESCIRGKAKTYFHPIIDWTNNDVWGYIRHNNIPYCSLYDEGFQRIGCILCPMARRGRQSEARRWPKIAARWRRWLDALYDSRRGSLSDSNKWDSKQDLWDWWIETPNANVYDLPCPSAIVGEQHEEESCESQK